MKKFYLPGRSVSIFRIYLAYIVFLQLFSTIISAVYYQRRFENRNNLRLSDCRVPATARPVHQYFTGNPQRSSCPGGKRLRTGTPQDGDVGVDQPARPTLLVWIVLSVRLNNFPTRQVCLCVHIYTVHAAFDTPPHPMCQLLCC